jgi:hypothetical protein
MTAAPVASQARVAGRQRVSDTRVGRRP